MTVADIDRASVFIESFHRGNTPFLDELETYAIENDIPVIRPQTQSFLRTLLAMIKPESVLEVGTAIGFSAILMAEYTPATCRITTIENYEKRIPLAKENFQKSGYADRITLLQGDAGDILPELNGAYDLIFMDAAKGQYLNFLPEVMRLLKTGGVLLSDNVLMDGVVLESRYAVVRRDRTIHQRMRDYLYEIKNHPGLVTDILPVGDGISLSVKV